MALFRSRSRSRFRCTLWLVGVALCFLAGLSACTVPITSQTITSGALNAGALLFIDRHNNESEGAYRYNARLPADSLADVFEAAVEAANHAYLFPRAEGAEGSEGGYASGAGAHAGESTRSRIPDRQWTPAPLFDVEPGSPVARGDTLAWVVTHRATRRVAFLLVPRSGTAATRVLITPYDPPADAFLSVPSDHAQRNAVEALHQTFYMAAVAHFGPGVFIDGPEANDADVAAIAVEAGAGP